MVVIPSRKLERQFLASGYDAVIGVDEVGMGCLAGPVVVGAVMLTPDFFERRHPRLARLRDSKLLNVRQREAYTAALQMCPGIAHVVVSISARQIDKLNILKASHTGMRRAVRKLNGNFRRTMVLVDGSRMVYGASWEQTPIVRGDRTVFSIAAASVLAKAHRDALMTRYAKEFPGYGFEVHKGYGTRMHRALLREAGPCSLHRQSFKL